MNSVSAPWEVCTGERNDATDPRDLLSERWLPNCRHGVHGAEWPASSSNHSSNASPYFLEALCDGIVAVNEAEGTPT